MSGDNLDVLFAASQDKKPVGNVLKGKKAKEIYTRLLRSISGDVTKIGYAVFKIPPMEAGDDALTYTNEYDKFRNTPGIEIMKEDTHFSSETDRTEGEMHRELVYHVAVKYQMTDYKKMIKNIMQYIKDLSLADPPIGDPSIIEQIYYAWKNSVDSIPKIYVKEYSETTEAIKELLDKVTERAKKEQKAAEELVTELSERKDDAESEDNSDSKNSKSKKSKKSGKKSVKKNADTNSKSDDQVDESVDLKSQTQFRTVQDNMPTLEDAVEQHDNESEDKTDDVVAPKEKSAPETKDKPKKKPRKIVKKSSKTTK